MKTTLLLVIALAFMLGWLFADTFPRSRTNEPSRPKDVRVELTTLQQELPQ